MSIYGTGDAARHAKLEILWSNRPLAGCLNSPVGLIINANLRQHEV